MQWTASGRKWLEQGLFELSLVWTSSQDHSLHLGAALPCVVPCRVHCVQHFAVGRQIGVFRLSADFPGLSLRGHVLCAEVRLPSLKPNLKLHFNINQTHSGLLLVYNFLRNENKRKTIGLNGFWANAKYFAEHVLHRYIRYVVIL